MSDGVKPVEATNLKRIAGVRHGFFTRDGGVSSGIYAGLNCGLGSRDQQDVVRENRARAASHLGSDAGDVLTVYQVHSADTYVASGPIARDQLPKADAVVTRTPGLAIGVLTADCTPVLFADAQAGVVAAAHAGWRGAAGGVVEATLSAMETLGASRERVAVAIGPTINQAAYEVGEDFAAQLQTADVDSVQFFAPGAAPGKFQFDLPGYVEFRLRRAGVGDIERQSQCTYDNESKFFSFRRATHRGEADYGRQISAIVVT